MATLLSGHQEAIYVKTAGNHIFANPQQVGNKRHNETLTIVELQAIAPSTTLSSPSKHTFVIPKDGVDELEFATMRFTVTNNDGGGNSLSMIDPLGILDKVEVQVDGTTVQVLYGAILRKVLCMMTSSDRFAVLATRWGINTSTYAPLVTVADGASTTLYLPLPTMLSSCKLPLWREEYDFRIVVSLRGGTDNTLAGSAAIHSDVAFSACDLLLDGLNYASDVRSEMDKQLNNGIFACKYCDMVHEPLTIGATTDGVIQTHNIHSAGPVAAVFFDLRSTSATNENKAVDSSDIDTIEILQNGQLVSMPHMPDNSYTSDLIKYFSSNHWINPKLVDQKNCTYISFAEDPASVLSDGAASGYYKFRSQATRVRLTPGATIASAQLDIHYLMYGILKLDFANRRKEVVRHATDF
jgi:hypothetical protein